MVFGEFFKRDIDDVFRVFLSERGCFIKCELPVDCICDGVIEVAVAIAAGDEFFRHQCVFWVAMEEDHAKSWEESVESWECSEIARAFPAPVCSTVEQSEANEEL